MATPLISMGLLGAQLVPYGSVLFTPVMNNIGKLRHARGMSQQQLANKLNTPAVSVGRYEREDQRLSLPLLAPLLPCLCLDPL